METANKNKARKAEERKLFRDSSAVRDVFGLYEDTETVQRDGAVCNPTGRPAALWSKVNYSGPPPPQLCTRTADSTSYLQEFCVHSNHQPMQGKGKREGKKEQTCRIGCHHPITHTQAPMVPG